MSAPDERYRRGSDDELDEDDDEIAELDELNASTDTSTFLNRAWFRWTAIAIAVFIVLSLTLPIMTALFYAAPPQVPPRSEALPDFVLPSAFGDMVRLSDKTSTHSAVVLYFYRGFDCENCRSELADIQRLYPQIRAEGAEFLAISKDSPADARRMADFVQASFPILSDEDLTVTARYGLSTRVGYGALTSATIIMDSNHILAMSAVGSVPVRPLEAQSVVDALRQINGRVQGTAS